jgi:putative oxidoreductase
MRDDTSRTGRASLASWKSSKLAFASRVLLGLLLISGGINNLLARNPVPNPTPEGDRFLSLLQETGYMLHAVALTEIGVGILLLSGWFVPLGLVIFAPIIVNIFLFHIFAQLAGIGTALVAAAFYCHLVYVHRRYFSDILTP